MPLTVPTWIAAVATVVLAIGVITAAWFARSAANVLSRQLTAHRDLTAQLTEVLQLHARELHQAIDERRRSQACKVFIDLDRTSQVTATVRNSSDQPVYDLYVIWQRGTVRMGKPDAIARLLPGDQVSCERSTQPDESDPSAPSAPSAPSTPSALPTPSAPPGDPSTLNAFLTFRDSAGVRWTVREDGTLSDISSASPHT